MERTDPTTPPSLPPPPGGPFLFVSYASVDRARVVALVDSLRQAGVELWIDQADIAGGAAYGTEIANALKASAAVVLMCSAASLASRNVRQEIMLAWRYDRPILPMLLEPTTFPDDIAYWLEGAQWIEVLDRPAGAWLPELGRALSRHGLTLTEPTAAPAAAGAVTADLDSGLAGNLPPLDGALIGRERETRELLALLGQGRWVTLTGPGGTGKTRLALEAARRAAVDAPGGVWLVDLAAINEPALVLPMIAATLGVVEEQGRSLLDLLVAHLGEARTLLVLDNVEQVAAGAEEVARLVSACDGLVVLATSRIPLQATGEWVYAVEPFALPDLAALPPLPILAQNPAVQLFVERAREARKDFVLTEGMARPVVEICHRLDGLPLAIELAAARVRLLPPAAILTRLGSRLNLLTRGSGANARQQTLRDTIAWSYGLLSPAEQTAFRRLAVFAGGASVEAAETLVAAIDGDVMPSLDDIAALIDHSLVRTEHPGAGADPRIRILETIREYASEQLMASGEERAVRTAHAAFFLDVATTHESALWSQQPGLALTTLRSDDDNLRISLEWLGANPETGSADAEITFVAALIGYWRRLGRYHEAAGRIAEALRRRPDGDPAIRAKALRGAGFIAARRGDATAAGAHYNAALALHREIGDRSGEADVVQYLAEVAESAGDFTSFQQLQEQVLAIRLELNDEVGIATATHDMGVAALYLGDYDAAIAQFAEAIPLFRRRSLARNLAQALTLLTAAEMLSGAGEAVGHAEESLMLWRTLDDRYAVANAMLNYGRALQLAGRHEEAAARLHEGLAECQELGDTGGVSLALYGLGLIALANGETDSALGQLAESLRLAHAAGETWHVAERVEGLAAAWVSKIDAARAARCLGGAALLRETGGFPLPPAERADHAQTVAAVESAMGPEAMTEAMATGRTLSLDDLVADALGDETSESPPSP